MVVKSTAVYKDVGVGSHSLGVYMHILGLK